LTTFQKLSNFIIQRCSIANVDVFTNIELRVNSLLEKTPTRAEKRWGVAHRNEAGAIEI